MPRILSSPVPQENPPVAELQWTKKPGNILVLPISWNTQDGEQKPADDGSSGCHGQAPNEHLPEQLFPVLVSSVALAIKACLVADLLRSFQAPLPAAAGS